MRPRIGVGAIGLWVTACNGGSVVDSGSSSGDETADTGADSTGDASDTSETSDTGDVAVSVDGAVYKGPFVLGTSVSASPLDGDGNPTGEVFQTQTLDDLGAFALELPTAGPVAFEASGFYYNEASGTLSSAPLTLRAYAVVDANGENTYLNLVTHLVSSRVPQLVANGSTAADAITQAEGELRVALGIGVSGFDPDSAGGDMNLLGGDTPANAYLLAVSAVLAEVGVADAGGVDGPVDAALQEFLNVLTSDLADDGALEATRREKIDAAELSLDPEAMMAAFAARLEDTGSDAVVPNVNAILDPDDDGIVNALDNCRLVANDDQLDTDDDEVGDACDGCPETYDAGQEDHDDDGAGDVCDADCGDAHLGPGEICDDGSNGDDSDECTDLCTIPVCGDGIEWAGEGCDDGDDIDGNGCNTDCSPSAALLWEQEVSPMPEVPDSIASDELGNVYVGTHVGLLATVRGFGPDGVATGWSNQLGRLCPDVALPGDDEVAVLWVNEFESGQIAHYDGGNLVEVALPFQALRRLAIDSMGRYVTGGGNVLGPQDFAVAVVDAGGTVVWSDVFDDPDDGPIGAVLGIAVTADDGVVAVGQVPEQPGGITLGVIRRYDSEGNVLWTDIDPGDVARWADVAIADDGDIIVAGRGPTDTDGVLRRYDDAGQEQWSAETTDGEWSSIGIAPGGHIVLGSAPVEGTPWIVARRDPDDGAELWTVTDAGVVGALVSVAPTGTIYALGYAPAGGAILRAYGP